MIIKKDKCEEDFLQRLITDSDSKFRLSAFYKYMAFKDLFTYEDIISVVENKININDREKAIKLFIDKSNNIDVIKR